MKTYRAFAALVLIWLALANQAGAAPVLMISIDGLSPEYVLKADAHGLKLPTLRRFLTEGTYAEGVIGVVPTVTYPSHTTLVTGVWPVEHGIFANVTFNPGLAVESWYWYAEDIRVPTLWDAAQLAGMVTASVSWPVTVGAKSVKYLIPEYWRVRTANDHKLMEAISRPDGMLAEMEERLGPYIESTDQGVPGDRIRTKFSLDIISRQKPGFMTIHLAALDHLEHETGPFSKESDETAEAIDEMVGQLTKAALANDPSTAIVVVSDHGFLPVSQHINLMVPFVKEGLIRTKDATASAVPRITSWDAAFWSAGGSAAVMLRDPSDAAVKAHVRNLLKMEMNPGAEPGYALVGDISTLAPGTGTHGYLPDRPEMRASFFVMGPKIAAGRDLGVIDMRRVAPTVAGILGVSLPTAKAAKLSVWQ
jgi:predicted AlkP superfamily pyrophosphatase or phosphodiesterase